MAIKETLMHAMLSLCGFGTCEQMGHDCYAQAEGTLPASKQRRMKRHLKICAKCLRFVTSYLAVKALGATMHPERMTAEQKAKILSALNLKA